MNLREENQNQKKERISIFAIETLGIINTDDARVVAAGVLPLLGTSEGRKRFASIARDHGNPQMYMFAKKVLALYGLRYKTNQYN